MPKLLLKFNMAVIKEIPIAEETTTLTIGRKEDNDIVIDNPAVSGHHAKIMKIGNKYFIEDLNSTNGTFISGRKILKAELENNMQVDITKYSLIFIDDRPKQEQEQVIPTKSTDETFVLGPEKQREILEKMAATKTPAPLLEKIGCLKITDGIVDKTEIELSLLNTYIGTTELAVVKIIPSKGLFGIGTVTGNIALINKRPDGYLFKAIKEGYCKINGKVIKEEIFELKEGDIIEIGKTKMVFFYKLKSDQENS